MTVHITVLLKETVEALDLKPGMVVADVTLGGGGHALEILKKIAPNGRLIALDQDKEAIVRFQERLKGQEGEGVREMVTLANANFATLKDSLSSLGISSVDAIVADLGISSDQLDDPARGLSLRLDGPLDMRLSADIQISAADIVARYSRENLEYIFREYADERYAGRIARAITEARERAAITTTAQLREIVERAVPATYRHGRIHPATRTFQALRMEVNGELQALRNFLADALDVLTAGGRMAVISFHSGEDALVKNALRQAAKGCVCAPDLPACVCGKKPRVRLLTRKPIVPTAEEEKGNSRSRSAKLRVAEKI